jgi:hypothetical protein
LVDPFKSLLVIEIESRLFLFIFYNSYPSFSTLILPLLFSPKTLGDGRPRPTPLRPETAWERGLRQAKEMKRLSQQRKETDVEYEEKRTTMSLTQAELVSSR